MAIQLHNVVIEGRRGYPSRKKPLTKGIGPNPVQCLPINEPIGGIVVTCIRKIELL